VRVTPAGDVKPRQHEDVLHQLSYQEQATYSTMPQVTDQAISAQHYYPDSAFCDFVATASAPGVAFASSAVGLVPAFYYQYR